MVGLRQEDITKEILLIFVICYEYKLNFTNVLKLFKISRRYFWTFMEICSPMLRLGTRKAVNIRKTTERILPYAQSLSLETPELTPREEAILQAFSWFVKDSFTDGEGCLHISQLSILPSIKGYRIDDSIVSSNADVLKKRIDEVDYITLGGEKYSKTTRMLYYLEKYAGDLSLRELDSLPVTEMIRRINDGMDRYAEKG